MSTHAMIRDPVEGKPKAEWGWKCRYCGEVGKPSKCLDQCLVEEPSDDDRFIRELQGPHEAYVSAGDSVVSKRELERP